MEQCLTKDIRERAKLGGIDVEGMDKEFKEIGVMRDKARRNVRKKRGWIKHFLIVLWTEFPIPRLGWTHPEEEAEYNRLNDTSPGGNE